MAKTKAKPKKTEATAASDAEIKSLLAEIDSTYGVGIMRPGRALVDNPKYVIPLSPSLDLELGGGFTEGSWVSMSGPEKCGKTVTALTYAAQAQKPEHGGRKVMLLSVEHRLKRRDLLGIEGLRVDEPDFYFIESMKGKILTSQDFLNIGMSFLKTVPGGVLIIDSISALCNPKVFSDGLGTADYGSGNKLLAQFCDMMAPVVKVNDSVIIGIVQYYANTTGRGADWNEKAAKRWKYQSDFILQCKYTEKYPKGDDVDQVGQILHWLIKTSGEGSPNRKCESLLRYGVGVDRIYEAFMLGQSVGLVSGKGWYNFDFLADKPELLVGTEFESKGAVKVQGAENCVGVLRSHPVWAEALLEALAPFIRPAPVEATDES